MKASSLPTSIDDYISRFSPEIQAKLQDLRAAIHAAAPEAMETISYQMPAFNQNGVLVYFAAFKDHLSFFPTGSGRAAFTEELSAFKGGKGTVHLPLDKPLPLELISRIVRFRVDENKQKAQKTESRTNVKGR